MMNDNTKFIFLAFTSGFMIGMIVFMIVLGIRLPTNDYQRLFSVETSVGGSLALVCNDIYQIESNYYICKTESVYGFDEAVIHIKDKGEYVG